MKQISLEKFVRVNEAVENELQQQQCEQEQQQ